MKKRILIMSLVLLLVSAPAWAMDAFPDLELDGGLVPESVAHYGVQAAPFTVSAIQGDYLLVEIFSLYCPICQRDAPLVNDMRRDLLAADTGAAIRFMGIGAGNTPYETDLYAKKYQAAFPVFPDEHFVAHKALNNVGTPAFYLVDLRAGLKVLYFHEGEMGDPQRMRDAILKAVRDNREQ